VDEERGIRPHGHYGREGQEGHSPQEFVKGERDIRTPCSLLSSKRTFAPNRHYGGAGCTFSTVIEVAECSRYRQRLK